MCFAALAGFANTERVVGEWYDEENNKLVFDEYGFLTVQSRREDDPGKWKRLTDGRVELISLPLFGHRSPVECESTYAPDHWFCSVAITVNSSSMTRSSPASPAIDRWP